MGLLVVTPGASRTAIIALPYSMLPLPVLHPLPTCILPPPAPCVYHCAYCARVPHTAAAVWKLLYKPCALLHTSARVHEPHPAQHATMGTRIIACSQLPHNSKEQRLLAAASFNC